MHGDRAGRSRFPEACAMRTRVLRFAGLLMLSASVAVAQPAPAPQAPTAPEAQLPAQQTPVYEEQVVVTASRTEQALVNAPATVTLISSQTIDNSPARLRRPAAGRARRQRHADLGARHQHHDRARATGTLSTSQLALVDGRSIYLDFFGFVAWDFLPIEPARDQADRGHPRPGVGRVGRQRDDRRRQRHHEDAARVAGRRRSR